MPNQELVNYIKRELAKGIDKQTIVAVLLSQGWQQTQIDEAFASISPQTLTAQQQTTPQSSNKTGSMKSNKFIILLLVILLLIIMTPVFFVFGIISSHSNTTPIHTITPSPVSNQNNPSALITPATPSASTKNIIPIDPMDIIYRVLSPDDQRKKDLMVIQMALGKYASYNKSTPKPFPTTLDDLIPIYLTQLPKDPKTGKLYEYIYNGLPWPKHDYKLCANFDEHFSNSCISSHSTINQIK